MILANYPPAFEPWEWGLGDGESSMPLSLVVQANHHILVKFQQPKNGLLFPWQVKMNVIFNYFRLRVEHVIGMIKKHSMFDGVYRGSYPLLKAAIDLTIQLTNMKIKMAPPR